MCVSFKDIWVCVCQMHDHLSEERVRPSEPISSDLRGIVHREGFVHEVVLCTFD